MNRLFRERNWAGVQVDPDDTAMKHDSVTLREQRGYWRAGTRQRFITLRRLSHWLISDWQHKRRHMQLPDLDFEPVRSGLFYSLRLGGVWVAADWWLHYFDVDEDVIALRLEHLQDDLNTHLLPFLPQGTAPFRALPEENTMASQEGLKLPWQRAAAPTLAAEDLKRIRHCNPRWHAWETRLYGDSRA